MHRSVYWQGTEAVEPRPSLAGDASCDVCLIGAGYTSLWTALALRKADPSLDVRIVEADYAGAGASGHNDGFVTGTIGHSLSTVVSRFGVARAKEAYAALGRSIVELIRFCDRRGIDAEIEPRGFYLVATSPGHVRRLEQDAALAAELGPAMRLRVLSREEMLERLPLPAVRAGIEGGGALVNPFKLVRGLARAAAGDGVTIYEQTRVTQVSTDLEAQIVTTTGGRIKARDVVFATDAYQHTFAEFRRHVIPVWSYALMSHPLTQDQMDQCGWTTRQGFVEARHFIVFGRLTRDNRVLIGGGPAPYFYGRNMDARAHTRNDRVERTLRAEARRLLPQLDGVRWSHFYGGAVGMTRNLLPQIGTLRPGWHFAHGYCGNGIAASHVAAKALSDLILGRASQYSSLAFVAATQPRFPPEPLAYLGTKGLTLLLRAQDRRASGG